MARDEHPGVRRLGLLLAALGAFAATVLAVFGALAIVTRFARTIVVPPRTAPERQRIRSVDPAAGTVTLGADDDASMPGRYSLWFDGGDGHARVGPIVTSSARTVTRELIGVDFGDIDEAIRGRISGWFYVGPWELGLDYEDVTVETDLGPAPAWRIPASEDDGRWAIMVHGWSVRRHEGLRAAPAFHAAGYTSLLISYRNDGEAPESADGRYGLGTTEWRDVEAAIRYAEEEGAREIVLMGWSMGGSIILQTVLRGATGERVAGIVLDSPAIDWRDILDFQGKLNHLPDAITRGVVGSLGNGWGRRITGLGEPIDFAALDVLAQASSLDIPMLVMHSDDDGFVPGTASRALAELRPDLVTFVEWTGARHAKLWNVDPERWDGTVTAWIAERSQTETRSLT